MIETERLLLRKARDSDAVRMYKMISSTPMHYKFTRIPYPYTLKMAKENIKKRKKHYRKGDELNLLIELKNTRKLIGTITLRGLDSSDNKAELGYALDKKATGKGYVTEAAEAIIDYGFKRLKLNRVEIGCATDNRDSRKVIRRLHADFEGVARKAVLLRGKYHDEYRYALLKKEWNRKVRYNHK